MNEASVVIALTFLFAAQSAWAQMEWREYPSMERGWYRDADIDFGYQEPGEFVVGRLMFPQARQGYALGAQQAMVAPEALVLRHPAPDRLLRE